ncbi:MAG: polar amino acid transport system permease protein [Chloroflexota bacterium]|nr:polar amino acid transport system permease protein [Chloroflexota bacterium]
MIQGGDGPADAGLSGLPRYPRGARDRRRASRRSLLIAIASSVVVFGLIGWLVVSSPGWALVQQSFFDPKYIGTSWPRQVAAVAVNIQLFLIAEACILPLALFIAVLRSLPGPVFVPVRAMALVYTDVFRGVPSVLFIFLLGFGVPALGVDWLPNDPFFWGVVTLVLVYSAYVSEVYRAGIESVHPSQAAAARSLGLTHLQTMRHVVIPQAVRRVIPPLLNDFIGLQKDTAFVSFIGVIEVFRQAQVDESASFNFTPYLVTAFLFLLLTVPLIHVTDWLVARDRSRLLAGTP